MAVETAIWLYMANEISSLKPNVHLKACYLALITQYCAQMVLGT